MNKVSLLLVFLFLLVAESVIGQSVIIDPKISSTIIEVSSTSKAVKMPTVSTTDAITSPQKGMVVFDDASGTLSFFNGSQWVPLSNTTVGWAVSGINLGNSNLGNVGIGTSVPNTKLHVKTGASGANVSSFSSAAFETGSHNYLNILSPESKQSGILFNRPTSSDGGSIIYNTDKSLFFRNNGTTNLHIKSDGKVGIGTTNPAAKTHISNGISGITPHSASDLVIEDDDRTYLSLLTPASQEAGILFGLPSSNTSGSIMYNNGQSKSLEFRTKNNQTQVTVDSLGAVILRTGEIYSNPTEGLNIVPLGIGKITFTYDDSKSETDYMTGKSEKLYGSVLTSVSYFSSRATLGCITAHTVNLNLSNSVVSNYDEIIVVPSSSWSNGDLDLEIEYEIDSTPRIRIKYDGFFCGTAKVHLSFLIYGVKK
jgi:hypothetical protein